LSLFETDYQLVAYYEYPEQARCGMTQNFLTISSTTLMRVQPISVKRIGMSPLKTTPLKPASMPRDGSCGAYLLPFARSQHCLTLALMWRALPPVCRLSLFEILAALLGHFETRVGTVVCNWLRAPVAQKFSLYLPWLGIPSGWSA
jgi:hypothetical protein